MDEEKFDETFVAGINELTESLKTLWAEFQKPVNGLLYILSKVYKKEITESLKALWIELKKVVTSLLYILSRVYKKIRLLQKQARHENMSHGKHTQRARSSGLCRRKRQSRE